MINKDKIIREANKVFDLIVFDKKHNPLLLSNEDILVIKDKHKASFIIDILFKYIATIWTVLFNQFCHSVFHVFTYLKQ